MEKYRILIKGIVMLGDKYLLVQRWYDDRISNPYQWEFVDGPIEFGEAPDRAVIRVVQEQTGLDVDIDRILYSWSFMLGDVCNIGIAYICSANLDNVLLSEELNDYKWVRADDFSDYIENEKVLHDLELVDL